LKLIEDITPEFTIPETPPLILRIVIVLLLYSFPSISLEVIVIMKFATVTMLETES
jgi:hypothetical protein